ncbi:JAB domain-containing protein [Bacillus licheniformis]|nr:JAB domain-containing protein [Bacillus licheniformis]
MVGHNHPSGKPEPSKEDIEVTKRIDKMKNKYLIRKE